ncbi:unnamed protein product [Sympodiomycopsis kandeliae]
MSSSQSSSSSSSSSHSRQSQVDHFTLSTDDGFPIAVSHFQPANPSSISIKANCVIVNATGVAARFYHEFANWLATQGVATCTFDFRYSGLSLPHDVLQKMKEAKDDEVEQSEVFHQALLSSPKSCGLMSHWTQLDLGAVVKYVRRQHPNLPLTLLGNSLGAHLSTLLSEEITFAKDQTQPVRVLNVCGGNAYWENNKVPEEARYAFDELIAKPLETDGVFRASSLGLGYDLPYGPGQDWLRWYYHPLFSLQGVQDEKNARSVGERLDKYLYVGFEDDETITEKMQHQHLSLFSHRNENIHSLWIDPPTLNPPWPKCGHVTSFAVSKRPKSSSQESEAGTDETPSGLEAYEPRPAADEAVPSEKRLTREETIFRLYLDFIVNGQVWTTAGRHKRWTAADQRDNIDLRRCEDQRRLDLRRKGEKSNGDFEQESDIARRLRSAAARL